MTTWVKRLLIANIVMFGIQALVPPVTEWLLFTPRLVLLRPWTLVTHMFLHGGPGHLFFNMLALFFFGSRVESRLGATRFVQLYFAAGITGGLFSLVMAPMASILGASGAVYGVMLAFAAFWPRERIYIWGIVPVEAWLLVLLVTAFSLYSGFGGSRGGMADFAHLGGFVGAYVYLWLMDRFSPARQFKARVSRVTPTTELTLKTNWRNVNLQGVHEISKDEVNRILDKISAHGVGSLTTEEKLFLSNFVPADDRKNWVQ